MHKVFEQALNRQKKAEKYIGFAYTEEGDQLFRTDLADHEPIFDEELAEWVQTALDWVHEYLAKRKKAGDEVESFTELKLEPGAAMKLTHPEDCTGTADWVCHSEHELVVLDLKGGYVYVEVEDNYQLLLYTIGAVHRFERAGGTIDRIRLVIAQPRAGGNKELVIRRKELDSYAKFFRKRAEATYPKDASLSASEEACEWCPASGICAEAHKMTSQLATQLDWPEDDSKMVLSEETRGKILQHLTLIRKLCDRIENEAVEQLMAGEKVDGYKLVEGRSLRVWRDAGQAERFLRLRKLAPFREPELLTPAAAERLLREDLPDDLTERPQGKPKLARGDDPRKEKKMMTVKETQDKSIAAGKER
jgi:hypothetical protein